MPLRSGRGDAVGSWWLAVLQRSNKVEMEMEYRSSVASVLVSM